MKHVRALSVNPALATEVPLDTKVGYIVAILEAIPPILEAKQPGAKEQQ